MAAPGSRFLKEPFECAHEHRFDVTERIMALQFETVERRLERIEAMIAGVEKRLWMTVVGVTRVFLSQAAQSFFAFAPK